MLLVNRGLITDLGEASFTRTWQYFITYTDIGFSRRALFGTVLTELRINEIIADDYLFARFLYSLLITCAYVGVTWIVLLTRAIRESLLFTAGIFFSPGFLLHLAYATGTQDVLLVGLLFAAVLYVRKPWLATVIAVAATLTHDLFIVLVPGMTVLLVLRSTDYARCFGKWWRALAPALGSMMPLLQRFRWGACRCRKRCLKVLLQNECPKRRRLTLEVGVATLN